MSDTLGQDVPLMLSQMAPREVAAAGAVLEREGPAGLVVHARELLAKVEARRDDFDALCKDLEAPGAPRAELVAAYLRRTVEDEDDLARDLAELEKRPDAVLDAPALGERNVLAILEIEIAIEAALAVGRARVPAESAPEVPLGALGELARIRGRWSRRSAALRWMRSLATTAIRPEALATFATIAESLVRQDEHRWVQADAFALLATVAPERALSIGLARLSVPGDDDDFLVRERFVVFLARTKNPACAPLLDRAANDPSDHVRIGLARHDTDDRRLERLGRGDASAKVRATALVTLARRLRASALPILAERLDVDPSGLVARAAAEELAALAKQGHVGQREPLLDLLVRAASRPELDGEARAVVRQCLARVDVLTDPYLALVYDLMKSSVAQAPVGGGVRFVGKALASLDDERLGRILAVLAQDDFSVSADRDDEAVMLYRGEPRRTAAWRVIHEVLHPGASKRQAYPHTWGRKPRGRLRAPPTGLAEITATSVPGERVLVSGRGDWGREIPLVDDVLATNVLSGEPVALVSDVGVTMIYPAPTFAARARGWVRATLGYAKLADLRRRSLESSESAVQASFARELQVKLGVRLAFFPRTFGATQSHVAPPPELPSAGPLPPTSLVLALPAIEPIVRDFFTYSSSIVGNRLPHVAAYAAVLLAGMLARGAVIKRSIDADRKAIPLVIGGWGTRGKSGTERLKAGFLQGMGYETLVKTTGCEAMFIHAIPGMTASEVFIYRPYDKATVWEQRNLLALGRRFGVRAFLWECMALQPDLVNLLQSQWMRDDYSTITNAYPDHEDVQGPAGFDVASVISEFVPSHGRLFTAEDQMLPIIRERARDRQTTLVSVGGREADLIADDMLARFPYHEHPRNIALVSAVARAMGVSQSVAIAEMADNVVPDLGVLKTYPTVRHAGRELSFTNGMSANERTGALSNWKRMKFDAHEPDAEPARWIVTVVNNRADRVARSEVFARFIVDDVSAHFHVLIGTNVTGLFGYVQAALAKKLAESSLTKDAPQAERRAIAAQRLAAALAFLKVPRATAESVLGEMAAVGVAPPPPEVVERALTPSSSAESWASSKQAVAQALAGLDPALVRSIAARRTARALGSALAELVDRDPARLDALFFAAYEAMYMETIVPLYDSTLTGDQIIDKIASLVPKGAHAAIMGIQNIKGTGLDFVYRWVAVDRVARALGRLASASAETRADGLRELVVHDDYGLLDAKMAQDALPTISDPELAAQVAALAPRLAAIVDKRAAALTAARAETFGDKVRAFVGKTFDYADSIRRQNMARRVVDDLVAGRISHAQAAIRMRDVVARAKGAWMRRKVG